MLPETLAMDLAEHLRDNIDGDPAVVEAQAFSTQVVVEFADGTELYFDVRYHE